MKYNVAEIALSEAERRLALLGSLATSSYDYQLLRERSHETWMPLKVLWTWWRAYQQNGLDGLVPSEWTELDTVAQVIIAERLHQLGEVINALTITPDLVDALTKQNGWSPRTTERWIRRYQVGGQWGLAPKHDPEKLRRQKKKPSSLALGTLNEAQLEETFRRRGLLGDLATKQVVSRSEMQARAAEVGVAPRTLWHYLHLYRQYGLPGLAPKKRSDKGTHHGISEQMEEIIRGVRFSQPGLPVRAVYETVCQKAYELGEAAPSLWQVRAICAGIPKPEVLLADKRDNDFRNRYEVTWRMEQIRHDSHLISYQIDHTLVDVLVQDLRSENYRTASGTIRPWLTTCIDSRSRLLMAGVFAYDRPDRYTVATAIREAVLLSDKKTYGGIPDEIWVDNGKELLSHHIQQLTQELHISLQPCAPHRPQQKGIVERFFGTLNTRLWATLPGYVNSNTVDRNPHAKAELSLMELEEHFWRFINRYHHEVHDETGETPLKYWTKHCYAEPADPRQLDLLLKEPTERKVLRDGIHYKGRIYWHAAISTLVGKKVFVRAEPLYRVPDEIEVYKDRQWICTAFAIDSMLGQAVSKEDIITAKQEQKRHLWRSIKHDREAAAEADRLIANLQQEGKAKRAPAPSERTEPQTAEESQPSSPPEKQRPKDLLERLAEQERDE